MVVDLIDWILCWTLEGCLDVFVSKVKALAVL